MLNCTPLHWSQVLLLELCIIKKLAQVLNQDVFPILIHTVTITQTQPNTEYNITYVTGNGLGVNRADLRVYIAMQQVN